MRALIALALSGGLLFAHTEGRKLPPSKAAKDLKRARRLQKEGKTEEFAKLILACKRTLVAERRYGCCIRGGCNECAFEQECACGRSLSQVPATAPNRREKKQPAKAGVCRECYAGWHAGRGSFDGISLSEIEVTEMEEPMRPMSSGTAIAPMDTPMYMLMPRLGNWTFGLMGQGHLLYSAQSSQRGGDKLFSSNWVMPTASRKLGPGRLLVRTMFSFEPATVTGRFYPQLFQTGETAFGRPIRDGQHPHSFFGELAAQYTVPVSDSTSVFLYGGPRGDPALGAGAYVHRMSQSENPLAVLGHHYQDSTHIATNVVTAGVRAGAVTIEASGFHGREPGERRWSLENGRIDSASARITVTPSSRWSFQFSGGSITSPEALHPDENAVRLTASAMHVAPLTNGHLATTFQWGRNTKHQAFNSFLAESTLRRGRNWYWARAELTDKDATLAGRDEEDRFGRVGAVTAGYARELPRTVPWLSTALGGQFTVHRPDAAFRPFYGSAPVSAQVFLRVRLAPADVTR